LRAMSNGLRHAAACPAPSHAQCPTFQRLLRAAAAGALERRSTGARQPPTRTAARKPPAQGAARKPPPPRGAR